MDGGMMDRWREGEDRVRGRKGEREREVSTGWLKKAKQNLDGPLPKSHQ